MSLLITLSLINISLITLSISFLQTRHEYDQALIPEDTPEYIVWLVVCCRFTIHTIKCLTIVLFTHILTVLVMFGIKHF